MDPVIFKHPNRPKSAWLSEQRCSTHNLNFTQKMTLLVPAVLPAPEYCTHISLSHPDLHAANIFINDDDSMSVGAIIDWQGAAIRPLFETVKPEFAVIDANNLKYAKLLGGDLQEPVLPDNFDALGVAQKLEAWHF